MKKPFKDTLFAKFLNKVKDSGLDIADIAITAVTDSPKAALSKTLDLVKGTDFEKEFEDNKISFEDELKAFELEVEDRKDARNLYKSDDIIQKVFSIVFLVFYGFMCWYMLEIIKGSATESELFKTMVTMIFTGTSTKLGTIIDFFFGGSMKK
jgi:hypothetical protein